MAEQQMRKKELQLVYTVLHQDAIKMLVEDSRISNIYTDSSSVKGNKPFQKRAEKCSTEQKIKGLYFTPLLTEDCLLEF